MFFGYPIAAIQENWLHESLVAMVRKIHEALEAGKRPSAWQKIIPASCRDQLTSRHGLKRLIAGYQKAATKLSSAERIGVLRMMEDQNRIADLLSCAAHCDCRDDLPAGIKQPVSDLFEFAFDLLTDLGIRNRHYKAIWDAMPSKMCPFCCDELFESPGLAREDYDHYLLKSRYPFAAANLRNLVPAGDKCNRQYKKEADMLNGSQGVRRRSFDPYGVHQVEFDLSESVLFGAGNGLAHNWTIRIMPDSEESQTWDAVYRVRERLRKNALNELNIHKWLGEFAAWFHTVYRQEAAQPVAPPEVITAATDRYASNEALKAPIPREFLRAYVFRWIHHHCKQPNERLIRQLQDVIRYAVPPG